MHYYKRNLGDYAKKAGRLTMLQHGAYTLLIDACYDREVFPTLEQAVEWAWASTDAEIDAVTFVLNRFFVLEDGRYVQDRISDELLTYHKTAGTNKRIANERETKRRELGTKRTRSVNEPPPNHKPLTTNHKPITNINTKELPKQVHPPVGVSLELWADYMTLRKSKKSPMTATALKGLERESRKAGITLEAGITVCVERNWVSLKAEWILQKDNTMTSHQIQNLAAARSIFGDERQHGNFEKIT